MKKGLKSGEARVVVRANNKDILDTTFSHDKRRMIVADEIEHFKEKLVLVGTGFKWMLDLTNHEAILTLTHQQEFKLEAGIVLRHRYCNDPIDDTDKWVTKKVSFAIVKGCDDQLPSVFGAATSIRRRCWLFTVTSIEKINAAENFYYGGDGPKLNLNGHINCFNERGEEIIRNIAIETYRYWKNTAGHKRHFKPKVASQLKFPCFLWVYPVAKDDNECYEIATEDNRLKNWFLNQENPQIEIVTPNTPEPTIQVVIPPINHVSPNNREFYKQARPGQSVFRQQVLNKYRKCVVTECDLEEVLEAAHIVPYSVVSNMDPDNGIALRSDIHILFDSNLLTVVEINRQLFWNLDEKVTYLPENIHHQCCDNVFVGPTKNYLYQSKRVKCITVPIHEFEKLTL